MSYFLLPRLCSMEKIEQYVHITYCKQSSVGPIINKTLYTYLNSIKGEIDSCPGEWDKYKKYTNPYEYIHTPITGSKQSVCKLKPLSRSYYKMIELCNLLSLLKDAPSSMKSFHLAEGPGGFIEALADMRKSLSGEYSKDDIYYGMTLEHIDDPSIPGWEKTNEFMENCPNFVIERGKTENGDLSMAENLSYCYCYAEKGRTFHY
jgi:hypothetical protein